jgi:putative ABC transport system permease protein
LPPNPYAFGIIVEVKKAQTAFNMIKNYLKLAFRHLIRKKTFSFINILGLTIGLTSCILIGLFISDELSFDTFNQHADRISRMTMEYSNGGTASQAVTVGSKAGPQFKRIFPEVQDFTRTFVARAVIYNGESYFEEKKFLYADSSFFKIFSFPLVKGDPTALYSKDNIILTAAAAQKYFGQTDPIGKTLRARDKDYRVAAIVADPPGNSQLQFDLVANFDNLGVPEEWWTANWITYLLLKEPNEIAPLEKKINSYMKTPAIRGEAHLEGSDYLAYHLQPLTRVHLYSSLEGSTPNGSIVSVYVLTIIAVLILAIACFNYTNLAIAQSTGRIGEIGVRKVLGALRGQLFTQFSGESLLMTMAALFLAVIISLQLLPAFNELTGKQLGAANLLQIRPLAIVLATGIIIGLLAGAYPALVLSGTRLINILRSGFRITGGNGGLRRSLIVVQFSISLFLIITTIVILRQISFIRNRDLGFDRDHVLVLPIDYTMLNRYPALKTAVSQLPGTIDVSGSYNLPVSADWGDGLTANNGRQDVKFTIIAIPCDLDFVRTMSMHLIAGSDFTATDLPANHKSTDSTQPRYSYILNETAVRRIGWTPQEAVGKTVSRGEPGIVKGVVRDFNFASMHQPIGPLMIFLDTVWVRNMLVRVSGAQLPAQIARLQAIWKNFAPDRPFSYHFLDEDYNHLYQTEQRTGQLFSIFSALAILLALLGLFGLAAISTVQRTKEIGIRKVLGADLLNISLLLARNFLFLIVIAFCIALPLAWLAAAKWLNDFAYRIDMPIWAFPLAGAAVLIVAFGTVSFHALRAGRMKPAESLKTE